MSAHRLINSSVVFADNMLGFDVVEYRSFLTPDECGQIIELGKAKGMQAGGTSMHNIIDTSVRSSLMCYIEPPTPTIVDEISSLAAALSAQPTWNQQWLQVASYDAGGHYRAHYDTNPTPGYRLTTLLIYLNDDFEGGCTTFPHLGITIRPETGKAIFFRNRDKFDKVIIVSQHQGDKVLSGQKWICNKWTHSCTFRGPK